MSTYEIANMLRAIAAVIERNSAEEIRAVTAVMARAGDQVSKKGGRPERVDSRSSSYFSELAAQLIKTGDRASAKNMLERESLTRKELVQLGQTHNVHITKQDKIDDIEGKIVEALVGSRLNSRAIRGEDRP